MIQNIFIAYIGLILTVIAWSLIQMVKPVLRDKHEDPKERRPIVNELKKMVGIKKRGSIFIPPSEVDEERQRIIEDRASQGLETPINLLRETDGN